MPARPRLIVRLGGVIGGLDGVRGDPVAVVLGDRLDDRGVDSAVVTSSAASSSAATTPAAAPVASAAPFLACFGRAALLDVPVEAARRATRDAADDTVSSVMISMIAIGALSPLRGSVLTMRVYPPGRLATAGAISANRVCTTFLSRIVFITSRRSCSVPFFAEVMRRSASGRSRFALALVVVILPCSNSDWARLARISRSCAGPPPRRGPLDGVGIGCSCGVRGS